MAERKNEIETKKTNEIENREDLKKWKRLFAQNATDDEFIMFVELAKRYDLDPFKGQIFLLKSKNNPNDPAKIFVSHAGLLHIAHKSGKFAGMKTMMITKDGKEALVCDPDEIKGAVSYIWRSDCAEPITIAVYFNEYRQPLRIWQTKPQTMIKKVAESHAIRRAFDLGGLYIAEEISEVFVSANDEEYQEEKQPKQAKKEVLRNNATLLAVIKRIEEIEKRFDVKSLKSTIEKKAGKKIEKMTERQLKQVLQLVDKYEAKKIEEMKQNTISDEDIIIEEPEDVGEVDNMLEEINENLFNK